MGSAVEFDVDFFVRDRDSGGHVEEIAEDLSGLGIGVAAHAAGEQAVEA